MSIRLALPHDLRSFGITPALGLAATIAMMATPAQAARSCAYNNDARLICSEDVAPAYRGNIRTSARARPTAAPHHHKKRAAHKPVLDANGNAGHVGSGLVLSHKTGAQAWVAPKYAAQFQGYIDDLEYNGATIYYIGGIRPGRCSDGHQHPCGKALDVCQDYRGHVSAEHDCQLPSPVIMAQIAHDHRLYEGSQWCGNPDYGHAQITRTGSKCVARGEAGPDKKYLATLTGKMIYASARTHHRRHSVHVHHRHYRHYARR